MQGSVRGASELVRPYFRLGLRILFLERVSMGWWLSKGEGSGVGRGVGEKGAIPKKLVECEG